MNKNSFFLFFAILLSWSFEINAAPQYRYFIEFKDKANSFFSLDRPQEFLSSKSVERRILYNIPYHISDLPVNAGYVSQVSAVPKLRVVHVLKWFNGVVIEVDSADRVNVLNQVMQLDCVKGNRQVRRYQLELGKPAPDLSEPKARGNEASSSNALSSFDHGRSYWQNRQVGVDCLHEKGFRGQGMTIAVLDAGFGYADSNPVFDSLRNRNGILGGRDFVSGGSNPFQGGTHGTMVLSCLAANIPGLIMGSAPMANYWLLRTEAPGEYITEEYNWVRGAEFADSVGADILTTSLGYTEFDDPSMNHNYASMNGRTAPISIAANLAARKGMFVLNSAGNERANAWHYISAPADADSVCAVGAVDSLGIAAAFSSVGPTSDGRIKPDLCARGAGTWVSSVDKVCFPGNGTSFSCPVLAGAVACYWQMHRSHNNIRILRELKNHASNSASANNDIGWGLPNVCPSFEFDFDVFSNRSNSIVDVCVHDGDFVVNAVEVADLNGKIVRKIDEGKYHREYRIDVGGLSRGILVVKVTTDKGTKSKKIIR